MQQAKGTLTRIEGASLLCVSFIFQIFNEVLPVLVSKVGSSAWISQIISSVLSLGLLALYLALFRRFEGKNILEILEEVFGKGLSKLFLTALLCYFLFLASLNLEEIISLLHAQSYAELHPLFLCICIMLVVCLGSRYSIKGLGITMSLFLPLLVLLIIFVLAITTPQYNVNYLFPIWGYGPVPVVQYGVRLLSNFEAFLMIAVFLKAYGGTRNFKRSSLIAIGISSASFIAVTFCYNMTFPYHAIFQSHSGMLNMTQSVYINRFFQRFESAFVAGITVAILLVLCVKLLAAKMTYCRLFGISQENSNAVVLPLGLVVICMAQLLSIFNIHENSYRRIAHRYSSFFAIGLVAFTLLVAILRKKGAGRGSWKRLLAGLLLPCLLLATFSGCGGYHEPDEEIYPVIMGYDKGESEKYLITFRLMLGKEAEGTPDVNNTIGLDENGDPPPEIFSIEAPSALVALDYLSSMVPKRFSLMHINMMIISEELAREDISGIVAPIIRNKETKNTMSIFITRGRAQDTILQPTGKLDSSLPMYIELIQEGRKGISAYTVVSAKDIYHNLDRNYGDPVVMYMGYSGMDAESPQGMDLNLHGFYEANQLEPDTAFGDKTSFEYGNLEEDASQETSSQDEESSGKPGFSKEDLPENEESTTGLTQEGAPQNRPSGQDEPDRGTEKEPSQESDSKDEQQEETPKEKTPAQEYANDLSTQVAQGFIPGQLPIQSSAKTEIAGMAILQGPKMVGYINSRENAILMMLNGKFTDSYYELNDPNDPNSYLVFQMDNKQPTKVTVELQEDGTPRIHLDAYLQGTIAVAQNASVYYGDPEHRNQLIAYTSAMLQQEAELLLYKLQTELEADSLRLGQHVVKKFSTVEQWEAYDWPARYLTADITVTMHFSV